MRFVSIACYQCKESFGMSEETYAVLKRSAQTFYCPFGHQQHFVPGKTEAQKLRDELDQERRRRQSAEQNVEFYAQQERRASASARAYKGQATKLRRRAAAGVCPCCKRTVKQLAAHMASKHPSFSTDPDTELPKDVPPALSVVNGGKA